MPASEEEPQFVFALPTWLERFVVWATSDWWFLRTWGDVGG